MTVAAKRGPGRPKGSSPRDYLLAYQHIEAALPAHDHDLGLALQSIIEDPKAAPRTRLIALKRFGDFLAGRLYQDMRGAGVAVVDIFG